MSVRQFHLDAIINSFIPQLNTAIGGTSDYVYLIVNDLGSSAETGLQFINGMTFLERFYFVYNSGTNEVGFATTSYTDATTN